MPATRKIQTVPVLAVAGLYAAGDAVGTTTVIPGVADAVGKGGKIVGIEVIDKAAQALGLTMQLYDAAPAVDQVDNGVYNPSDADAAKGIAAVAIVAGDYIGGAANKSAYKDVDIDFVTQNGNLYYQLFTQGAPTYAAGDLIVIFHVHLPDAER